MRPTLLVLCAAALACKKDATAPPPATGAPEPAHWAAVGGTGTDLVRGLVALESGRLLRATRDGVEASTDAGETWSLQAASGGDLPDGAIPTLLSLGGDGVLAWVHGKGAWRSADAGETWAPVSQAPEQELLRSLLNPRGLVVPRATAVADDGTVWMAALGGLFSSRDGGDTWDGVDLAATGSFNVLFTDIAVQGDTLWAVSQIADSMLPGSYQGLLSGTVFTSDDGGATWREVGDGLGARYATAVALRDDEVCVGAMDLGVWCGDGASWADEGGPTDPIDLEWSGAHLLAASASAGPWVRTAGAWSETGDRVPMAGLAGDVALSVAGERYTLDAGEGPKLDAEDQGGTVHVALSFHTNYYHSYRGDTNDEDGYGKDIRVIRTILDWLDAHPDVHADWDIENHFSLDGWMATESPDITARIRERVDAGQDDVRIMSWNNGAMASSTRAEFDEAVRRAQASGLAAFGRMVPGVQPQECMFSPDHIGWYKDLDVTWVTLFYSATGFTGPRLDVDLSGAALHNPVNLRDPLTGDTLTWVPAYHHADVLDHGGLRGWTRQLRQAHPGTDSLLLIHFDADAESWENFDREIEAIEDLVEQGEVEWTTIDAYLRDHDPVATVDLPGDVADGTGDGFQSWAEKDFNHRLATTIATARDAAEQAAFLAGDDVGLAGRVEDAREPRLLALSTTHFGLAAPYLADDRVASAEAYALEALEAAEEARAAAIGQAVTDAPLVPGTLVLVNARPSSGTALVETQLRIPRADWIEPDAVAIHGEDGAELPIRIADVRNDGEEVVVTVSFAAPVAASSTHTLTWAWDATGARAQGGLSPEDVVSEPVYDRLGLPFTQCDGVVSSSTTTAPPPTAPDPRGASAVDSVEATTPFCDAQVRTRLDRSVYAGLPGLVVSVFAQVGEASDPTLAESIALSPFTCSGPASRIQWQGFGGTIRERPVRPGVETWNGQAADGWAALTCESGRVIQISHRVNLRTSLAFLPFTEQEGKAVVAPLGTVWGDSPWHDAPRTGGTGLGDTITSLVGSQYRPAAPDWSGQEIRYRLLVGEDLDPGTLDLFAHPPLALVGPAAD